MSWLSYVAWVPSPIITAASNYQAKLCVNHTRSDKAVTPHPVSCTTTAIAVGRMLCEGLPSFNLRTWRDLLPTVQDNCLAPETLWSGLPGLAICKTSWWREFERDYLATLKSNSVPNNGPIFCQQFKCPLTWVRHSTYMGAIFLLCLPCFWKFTSINVNKIPFAHAVMWCLLNLIFQATLQNPLLRYTMLLCMFP